MRKWFYAVAILAAIGMTACKKGSSDSTNGTLTTNGVNTLSTNCLNTTVANNNGFCNNVNFANNTFTRYPVNNGYYQGHNHGYSNGFAGCGYQALAVYHPSVGLACIPISYLRNLRDRIYRERRQYLNLAYWNWNSTSYNFSFYGWMNSGYNNVGHMGTFGLCNPYSSYGYGLGSGSCIPVSGNWGIWGSYSYEYEETTYYNDSGYNNNGYY